MELENAMRGNQCKYNDLEETVSKVSCENEKLLAYNAAIKEDFDVLKAEIAREVGALRAECVRLSQLDGVNLNLQLDRA